MEKVNLHRFSYNFNRLLILTAICFSFLTSVNADECSCQFCAVEDVEESIIYEDLGEYEEIFRTFEQQIDLEDDEDLQSKTFFVKKWCKKARKWFKKSTVKLFKKMINLKRMKNGEDCAYTIARFKRKIDKKLHNTGDIENILDQFGNYHDNPEFVSMETFKERIRFYYYNQKATPCKNRDHRKYDCSKPQYKGELDDIPLRALVGGVEVACGSLITAIPIPGCRALGVALAFHGMIEIQEAYILKYEKEGDV